MKVKLFTGDIIDAPVDVVVSATNPALEMVSATGSSLHTAGGPAIQEECNRLIKNERIYMGRRFFPEGTAHWTSAGALPLKGIIHCVALDAFLGTSYETVERCVYNSVRLAGLHDCRSIAMPLFNTGAGRYDFTGSLQLILHILEDYEEDLPEEVVILARGDWLEKAQRMIDTVFYSAGRVDPSAPRAGAAMLGAPIADAAAAGEELDSALLDEMESAAEIDPDLDIDLDHAATPADDADLDLDLDDHLDDELD